MKLYTHPDVLILRLQLQDKDSGIRVFVAVGGPAFMVHPIPALETVLRPSNSRAHPREKAVGMALTEPSFSTNLWGWSSHFIQEDTEVQPRMWLADGDSRPVSQSLRPQSRARAQEAPLVIRR